MTTDDRAAEGAPGKSGAELVREGAGARAFVASNWRVLLYVVLIVLAVVFAPERPLKFIYTEF
jgi:hypothetical protein